MKELILLKNIVPENLNLNATHKNVVLFGESGACKTLFLIKLIIELYNDKRFDQHLISYRKLRDLAGQGKNSN